MDSITDNYEIAKKKVSEWGSGYYQLSKEVYDYLVERYKTNDPDKILSAFLLYLER